MTAVPLARGSLPMTTTSPLDVTTRDAMNPLTIAILLLVCAVITTFAYVALDERA